MTNNNLVVGQPNVLNSKINLIIDKAWLVYEHLAVITYNKDGTIQEAKQELIDNSTH